MVWLWDNNDAQHDDHSSYELIVWDIIPFRDASLFPDRKYAFADALALILSLPVGTVNAIERSFPNMGVCIHNIIYLSVDYLMMTSKRRGEEPEKNHQEDPRWDIRIREHVLTNWTRYDQTQIHEMVNYLDNIRDLVGEADRRIKDRTPPRKRGSGRM